MKQAADKRGIGMAKLSDDEKKILREWGFCSCDMEQIELAISKSRYILINLMTDKKDRISEIQTRELLGNKQFLSGISRSSFHRSAVREVDKHRVVYFDSSKLFM